MIVSRCSGSFGASRGGVDVLARRHAVLLSKEDRVVFVGLEPIDDPSVRSLIVQPGDLLPSHGGGFVYLANEAYHVLRATLVALRAEPREPVDLVISNSSLSTVLLKALGRRPVIHYVHDALYEPERDVSGRGARRLANLFLHRLLEGWAIRRADRVICPSRTIAGQAAAVGAAPAKLSVMYPLVARSPAPEPPSVPSEPAAIPAPAGPYLLTVGQQTGRKRFDLVIRALTLVPAANRLVLVGDGPMHATYPALARELGVADRVDFRSAVNDAELAVLYEHCTTYVLASENEGFPITIAEALLHGRPAVLACPGVDPDEVERAGPCLAILRGLDVGPLAGAITDLLERERQDPVATRRTIREWAREAFPSEEQLLREYGRIFGSLL